MHTVAIPTANEVPVPAFHYCSVFRIADIRLLFFFSVTLLREIRHIMCTQGCVLGLIAYK